MAEIYETTENWRIFNTVPKNPKEMELHPLLWNAFPQTLNYIWY